MKHPRVRVSRSRVIGAVFATVVGIIIFLIGKQLTSIGFKTYEPGYLPQGTTVTTRKVIKSGHGLFIWEYRALDFEFNDPSLRLLQDKNRGFISYSCEDLIFTWGGNCKIRKSPSGTVYRLVISNGSQASFPQTQEVTWAKDGTAMRLDGNTVYPREELERIIDGMVARSYDNLPVETLPDSD